ncbi:lecithin retinol acyltransferase family protein [Nocardia bovistercoris]|uniref:Lecithin retinol acyltransferase family protein n=1 Tax=Nocardia bovistercoris TaxID=2785916 RepID=A0A931I940_9NOCA|nr:lecithin retinol acyltransferase family protein [Nocardia bovistercoris]
MTKGDHIKFHRLLGVEHHAIDMGDGTVIEFRSGRALGKMIRRVALDQVRGRSSLITVRYDTPVLPAEETCRRAEALLEFFDRDGKQRGAYPRYNLFAHNCEHFATMCKTGESMSEQVADFQRGMRGGARTYLLLTAAGLAIDIVIRRLSNRAPDSDHGQRR